MSSLSEEVSNFLNEKPYLMPVLIEACQKVRSIFTDEQALSLTVEIDPEIRDLAILSLSIHVGNKADFEEVDSLLNKLDDEWWIDASSSVPDLNIDVKFN